MSFIDIDKLNEKYHTRADQILINMIKKGIVKYYKDYLIKGEVNYDRDYSDMIDDVMIHLSMEEPKDRTDEIISEILLRYTNKLNNLGKGVGKPPQYTPKYHDTLKMRIEPFPWAAGLEKKYFKKKKSKKKKSKKRKSKKRKSKKKKSKKRKSKKRKSKKK